MAEKEVIEKEVPKETVVVDRDNTDKTSNTGVIVAVLAVIIILLLLFFGGNLFGGSDNSAPTDVNVNTPSTSGQ